MIFECLGNFLQTAHIKSKILSGRKFEQAIYTAIASLTKSTISLILRYRVRHRGSIYHLSKGTYCRGRLIRKKVR